MSRFVNLEFEGQFEPEHESSPRDEQSYFAEARALFERADFERALRYYSKVLEFNPQNAAAWAGQVRALIELGEFREAKLWADKALERFPREPELLAAKAVALGRTGDLDAALAFSDASIEERGDTPYIWLARGDVLLAREERRADYCFDKALLLAPTDWFVAWLGARIRFWYRQFALALKFAKQAVEWNPTHATAWVMLGLCQKELGMTAPARVSFSQALQLDPRCVDASKGMGDVSRVGLGSQIAGWWRRLFQP
jgi:tetratricopeptide (TPR) repeat protein